MKRDTLRVNGDAFITCYAAWLHPDDHDVREAAVLACAVAGIDYVEVLAKTLEEGHDASGNRFTPETARYAIAASWLKVTEQHYALHGYNDPLPVFDPDAENDPFDPRNEGNA